MSWRLTVHCLQFAVFVNLFSSSVFSRDNAVYISDTLPGVSPEELPENLNRNEILFTEKKFLQKRNFHFSLKPFTDEKLKRNREKNHLVLEPVFSGRFGYETETEKIFPDGFVGLNTSLIYENKFLLSYFFLSGISAFPSFIDTTIQNTGVVPGMGSGYAMTSGGYSYQHHSGAMVYSPNRFFNFQFGYGKNFWGDGYRSLFLSDVSNSYPFFKITTSVWKMKYAVLYGWFKDVTAPSHLKKDFKNKFGTFHYLSWNVTTNFNLGFFEAILWQGTDENRYRNFEVNYLNPVIFFRPVEFSIGSSDNVLLGIAARHTIGKKNVLYGQWLLDEFLLKEIRADVGELIQPDDTMDSGWWGNKYGLQFGWKSFDLFNMENLFFQTELNAVRPYTYSHGSVQQNYGHYNQPLAHPFGANFFEWISFLNYRWKKWFFETEFLFAIRGKNLQGTNFGGDIFQSYSARPKEYGNYTGQGIRTALLLLHAKTSYYIGRHIEAEAGYIVRSEKNVFMNFPSDYFYIGIRTRILNQYLDF